MITHSKLCWLLIGALIAADSGMAAAQTSSTPPNPDPNAQNPSQSIPGPAAPIIPGPAAPGVPHTPNTSLDLIAPQPTQQLPNFVNPPGMPQNPSAVVGTAAPGAQRDQETIDRQITLRVRTAITQGGPPASGGFPSPSAPSAAVEDLRVTTLNGKVTLEGFVHSERERTEVAARAAMIVGGGNVINQLIVR
ncbi:MAG: BON domain-containing protein [Elusimicrobia bacterium]|nr:BON domain-containing protein [Elusimicrobiota bacterium]